MSDWFTPDTAPAWAQAASSSIAIGVAIWISRNQIAKQRREELDRETRKRHEARTELALALAAELQALVNREARIGMCRNYRELGNQINVGGTTLLYDLFIAKQNYTVVFDSNANRLGLLPHDLLVDIVTFYTDLRGVLDSINAHAELVANEAAVESARMANELAKNVEEIVEQASGIAAKLREVARNEFIP